MNAGRLTWTLSLAFCLTAGCGDQPPGDRPCDGFDCSEHGSCVVIEGSAQCVCDSGYAGDACSRCDLGGGFIEHPGQPGTCISDPCAGMNCSGHGTCTLDGLANPTCDCDIGHAGAECQACDGESGYLEDPQHPGECVLDPCLQDPCQEGKKRCLSDTVAELCQDGCWTQQECPPDHLCLEGECLEVICQPGTLGCQDDATPQECNQNGTAWDAQTPCQTGWVCREGACRERCQLTEEVTSQLGCRFVAVDLDNLDIQEDDPASLPVTLLVTNPGPDPAQLSAEDTSAGPVDLGDGLVPAGEIRAFELPRLDLNGSGIRDRAFYIQSDVPISLVQLNPGQAAGASTDGSLLLPLHVLGQEYLITGWPSGRLESNVFMSGQAAVVAIHPGTTVTVVSPTSISLGPGVNIFPNVPAEFELEALQVLSLETMTGEGLDLTGMTIISEKEVAVFTGHRCANVPIGVNMCDHLEEQLFPVELWGEHHLAIKAPPRGTEPDVFRILAAQDNTTVTTLPPQGSGTFTLNRGEFYEIAATQSFEIISQGPVQVAQFLVGSSHEGVPLDCTMITGLGDPSLAILLPTDLFATDMLAGVPSGYSQAHLAIAAPAGASVTLGEEPIPAQDFFPIGSGDYQLTYPPVEPGTNRVRSDLPVGIWTYTLDCSVSSAFPAGFAVP